MLLEWQKGEDSFWKQYLDSLPVAPFFCHWDKQAIEATQDEALISSAVEYREDVEYQWDLFRELMLTSPEVFEERTATYEVFLRIYGQVATRCFDIGNGEFAMVPMADNYNHSHMSVEYYVISKR